MIVCGSCMVLQSPRTIAGIGTSGNLRIEYARQGHRTIMAHSHCTSPWHLFPPIYLDDSGAAYTLLLNPSGGLVGGDRLTINLRVKERAHAIISTPSANRVYRTQSTHAAQVINLTVEPDGLLEWLPEPTIPFAGSRFRQVIHVRLAPGGAVTLWDAVASGRIAQGERWAFAGLDNDLVIVTASNGSLKERFHVEPDKGLPGRLVHAWDYIGSLYIVSDAVSADKWKSLELNISTILNGEPGRLLGGVSRPAVPGLVVKLVAGSAPVLAAVLDRLWTAVRGTLWGLPPLQLRKY
jgi:urease accessory protein